ncbi:hypothetical protein [Halodesulfovibrio sp. MK-HDV]|uniref:hypothetical protein n=1 Tax=Halodesulfovibrio sp. MK-HDV TaxID=2599925 RepID=UPI0013699806|nr:hypothetical protein [Halodesulfovibrio sp. MK-HDV]
MNNYVLILLRHSKGKEFYVPNYIGFLSEVANEEKLLCAVAFAHDLARSSRGHLTFLVPTAREASLTVLDTVLDESFLYELRRKRRILGADCSYSLESVETIQASEEYGIVLVLCCNEEMLKRLEQCSNADKVVILSRNPEEVRSWVSGRGAAIYFVD